MLYRQMVDFVSGILKNAKPEPLPQFRIVCDGNNKFWCEELEESRTPNFGKQHYVENYFTRSSSAEGARHLMLNMIDARKKREYRRIVETFNAP